MNIFYLDKTPSLAAAYHCDKHVVKMILETAQMLSAAHHHYDSLWRDKVYKPTHINHPMTQWVIAKPVHYYWARRLLWCLLYEYSERYGKSHKTESIYKYLCFIPHNKDTAICLEDQMHDFDEPPQCMPDQYKCDDTVQAYRTYYMHEKSSFAKWDKTRAQPWWYSDKFNGG